MIGAAVTVRHDDDDETTTPTWCRALLTTTLLTLLCAFLVLFLDVEFTLLRRDASGAFAFFSLGRLACWGPNSFATLVDAQHNNVRFASSSSSSSLSSSAVTRAFGALAGAGDNESIALFASRLPKPAKSFVLALPTRWSVPSPLYADDFALRGVRAPLATVVVHSALRRLLAVGARNNNASEANASSSSSSSMLFVDVGVGSGYFTALAASAGFATLSLDANERLLPYLTTTLLANGWLNNGRTLLFTNVAVDEIRYV